MSCPCPGCGRWLKSFENGEQEVCDCREIGGYLGVGSQHKESKMYVYKYESQSGNGYVIAKDSLGAWLEVRRYNWHLDVKTITNLGEVITPETKAVTV